MTARTGWGQDSGVPFVTSPLFGGPEARCESAPMPAGPSRGCSLAAVGARSAQGHQWPLAGHRRWGGDLQLALPEVLLAGRGRPSWSCLGKQKVEGRIKTLPKEGRALWCSLVAWGHLSKCCETVWAGFREVNTLAKVGEDAELVHCGVSPRCCPPCLGCEHRAVGHWLLWGA